MQNTILCVKWGDKYGNEYVEKLKDQVEKNCSVSFNFYCLTDNPTQPYDIQLPTTWDAYENGNFWAYIYSWYKGNVFPDDMEPKKKREDCKICLFNNSGEDNDTEELKLLWNT